MEQFTSIIIGAGPSGIGVACGLKELEKSKKSLILEKNNRVGGLAGSFKLDNDIIDFGPHGHQQYKVLLKSQKKLVEKTCWLRNQNMEYILIRNFINFHQN